MKDFVTAVIVLIAENPIFVALVAVMVTLWMLANDLEAAYFAQ